jgi:tetratricopeptide (TPR) repeat protein
MTQNNQLVNGFSTSERFSLAQAFLGAIEEIREKSIDLLKIAEKLAPNYTYSKALILQTGASNKVKSLPVSPTLAQLRNAQTEVLTAGECARNFSRIHLGEHHPYCFLFCLETSDLCTEIASKFLAISKKQNGNNGNSFYNEALQNALSYRQDALALAVKVVGRMHPVTKDLVISIGSINKSLGNYQEAMGFFLDALKTNQSKTGWLYMEIAECNKLKGDIEEAFEYTLKAKLNLENLEGEDLKAKDELLDVCLLQIAQLAQTIYPGSVEQEHIEVLGKEAREILDQAIDAYETLFERLRSRPDSIDGDNLVRILKQLISLKIRLASPAERTVIHAIRGQGKDLAPEDDAKCKDMLVRMVTMNSATQHINRILEQGTTSFDRKHLRSPSSSTIDDLRTLILIADSIN